MTDSNKSRLSFIQKTETNDDQELDHSKNNVDLTNDPDYLKFIDHYQRAEFSECKTLVESLEVHYPEHPELQAIRDDLNMRMSVNTMTSAIKKGEARAKSKVTLKLLLFTLVGIITITAVFILSSFFLLKRSSVIDPQALTSQLASLYLQADQLLLGGQPKPASEIVEKIRAVDPDYEKLPGLVERTNTLLALDVKYQTALNLIKQKDQNEALILLKQIELENPGMWDIPQLIDAIDKDNQIAEYKKAGNSAYQKEKWDQVISAYENALSLDQSLNDPLMVEQLLFAYLNSIITMLQNDSTAIEDIEVAEQYYRKAVALIPQNKEFFNQRENLQEVSSNLLELKYTQLAKENLADKNQTITSISKAISYLRKALSLNPKNNALQADLTNAEIYKIGFQYFVAMEWAEAVTKFDIIVSSDKNFAAGNASALLYEAYYALGQQYFNAGLYIDARNYLEQAEILAWSDGDNSLKLFQVQVLLGDTIGKLEDFMNAVSYYKYALDAIKAQNILLYELYDIDLYNKYSDAYMLAGIFSYRAAFTKFQELFEEVEFVNTISEIEIGSGVCLALFASDNLSTLEAVMKANDLPKNMIIPFKKVLSVPSIQN